jgi:hypothetical protein
VGKTALYIALPAYNLLQCVNQRTGPDNVVVFNKYTVQKKGRQRILSGTVHRSQNDHKMRRTNASREGGEPLVQRAQLRSRRNQCRSGCRCGVKTFYL